MPIIYRLEKGAPLTTEELDNNFRELHKRLETLEHNPGTQPVWGGHVELQGAHLVFLSPTKQVMSQIPLPLPHLSPRGNWQPRQSYAVYDIVSTGKQTYCCIKSHQSSDQFVTDQDSWRVLIDLNLETTQEKKT